VCVCVCVFLPPLSSFPLLLPLQTLTYLPSPTQTELSLRNRKLEAVVKVLHGHGVGTAKENDTPLEMLMSQAGAKIVTEDKHKANMVMSPPSMRLCL